MTEHSGDKISLAKPRAATQKPETFAGWLVTLNEGHVEGCAMGKDRKQELELLSEAEQSDIQKRFIAKRNEVASSIQEFGETLERTFGPLPQVKGPQYDAIANSFKALEQRYVLLDPFEASVRQLDDGMQMVNQAMRQVLEPLQRMSTAFELYNLIKQGNEAVANEILASQELSLPLIKMLVHLTELNEEDRAKEKAKAVVEALAKLERICKGPSQRTDAKDKAEFIKWVREKPVNISNIAELLDVAWGDWPIENSYGSDTLKAWYKEARPDVRLKGGRPTSKNRPSK